MPPQNTTKSPGRANVRGDIKITVTMGDKVVSIDFAKDVIELGAKVQVYDSVGLAYTVEVSCE